MRTAPASLVDGVLNQPSIVKTHQHEVNQLCALCRYAGAGLFESVQSRVPQAVPANFYKDLLATDQQLQALVLGRIATASAAVETAAGSPQDIEGVVTANGNLYIVQTRPQV